MQAYSNWLPPTGTLGRISAEATIRAQALEPFRAQLESAIAGRPATDAFGAALRASTGISVIAEVKRRSPSKGAIADALGAAQQAEAYRQGGAACVSILTEPAYFGGSNEDLLDVRRQVDIPALKKDFHVAPIQLLEARALGASAALIIVRALSPTGLAEMMEAGRALNLELLVEVRDEGELERALDAGATIVGVNNRDLETLIIDGGTAERIIPLIPVSVTAVAESGVARREDVHRYADAGADAVLVGSTLSASPDPVAATRALAGVPRRSRAR
ncbi:MAG: indole-3-glycerol-phosphate synthase [Gemmatimonadota bacterium]